MVFGLALVYSNTAAMCAVAEMVSAIVMMACPHRHCS